MCVQSLSTIPFLIHIHACVVLLPLLSLLFLALPLSKDRLWVETCGPPVGNMCAGQTHMSEPASGDIIQELFIAFANALDASSKLTQPMDRTEHCGDFVHLLSDASHEVGAFPSNVASGLCGWLYDWLLR